MGFGSHRTAMTAAAAIAVLVVVPVGVTALTPSRAAVTAQQRSGEMGERLRTFADAVTPRVTPLPNPFHVDTLLDPTTPDPGAHVRLGMNLPGPASITVPIDSPVTAPTSTLPVTLPTGTAPVPGTSTSVVPIDVRARWLPLGETKPAEPVDALETGMLFAPRAVRMADRAGTDNAPVLLVATFTADPSKATPAFSGPPVTVTRSFVLNIPVGRLGVPSVALLFRDRNFDGAGLAVIDRGAGQAETLSGQANQFQDLIALLGALQGDFPRFGNLRALMTNHGLNIVEVLRQRDISSVAAFDIPNLNDHVLKTGRLNNIEAENTISSMFVVNAGGRSVEGYNRRNFDTAGGALRVSPLNLAVAVRDLGNGNPPGSEPVNRTSLIAPPAGIGVSSFNDELSSLRFVPGGPVGDPRLAPSRVTVRAGGLVRYRISWTHPRNWNDLRSVQLRLTDGRRAFGWVSFDQGTRTLRLLRPDGRPAGAAVRPGARRVLSSGHLRLLARRSAVVSSGPRGRKVTLTLRLRIGVRAGPRALSADLIATDDRGARQGPEPSGVLLVRPATR